MKAQFNACNVIIILIYKKTGQVVIRLVIVLLDYSLVNYSNGRYDKEM